MSSVVITHRGCNDGLTAAWILKRAFPDCKVIQRSYHEDPPLEQVQGCDVLLTDLTWEPKRMEDLLEAAHTVTIYDHHETAERLLDAPEVMDHPDFEGITLDKSRSAARIIWDEFGHITRIGTNIEDDDTPRLVKHVEDRDLWTNKRENTPAVTEWLYTLPRNLDAFQWAHKRIRDDYRRVVEVGQGIVDVKKAASDALLNRCWSSTVDIHNASVVNGAQRLSSTLGHKLAEHSPSSLGLTFWKSDDGYSLSLRSTDDGPNVAEIADDQWDGGGHPNAAGAWVNDIPINLRPPKKKQ